MLLINPATEKFGGFMSRYVPAGIPVALGCIIAHLESHGIKCKLIDEELMDINPSVLREAVDGLEKPYIIGLTCLTAHVGRAYQIAKMIKNEFTDSIVVLGGLHPTSLPEEALNTGVVDFVVRGEGEEVMLHLYRSIRGDSDVSKLLGVSYIQGDEIINKPQAPLIPDINDIPMFPYHLFENPKYDMGFMTTSRGCPYRCSYCSQRLLTGTTYRYKSAQNIIEELDILVSNYNQGVIELYDDNFCLKARRVHELCDLLIENNFPDKLKISVQTRADNVLMHGGEDMVRHMAEAGFSAMGFGLETGVQRLADLIRKDETVECHLEATELCKKYGLTVSFFMIFGLPTETSADREHSYQVVKSADLHSTKYNNLIPYPGTPLFTELKDSGRINITENWGNFNSTLSMTRSIFDNTPLAYVPDTCSEWELKRDITKYNYKSYVNLTALAGIFGHTKVGGTFVVLPNRWYLKPRELFEMVWIAVQALTNIIMAFLPLKITEPFMNALNPRMKKRLRIKNYDPESYIMVDWDKIDTKEKMQLLKKARDVRKTTGQVSIVIEE